MKKSYKTFSLMITHDYAYKIGMGPVSDYLVGIEIPEDKAPVLNLNLEAMPLVCRSNRRHSPEKEETYFLADDAIKVA